jgi:preprotein translocase subunit SecF
MSKTKVLIAIIVLILVIASIGFFYVVTHREDADFKESIIVPTGIAIFDKGEIRDQIVAKTLVMEIQKSNLEKATKQDLNQINTKDTAFSIRALYKEEVPESGQLVAIVVLKDGTFVASKNINGRLQYAKGKFGSYTMDYLTGLYTVE